MLQYLAALALSIKAALGMVGQNTVSVRYAIVAALVGYAIA